MLVGAGVSVNAEDNTWVTPVMHAAAENHVDIIEFLVKHGSMISLKDKNGESALSKAVDNGHLHSTQTLLRLGADCNIRTQGKFSNTLIHIAAKRDNPQILKLLLEHDAKYEDLCNMLGQTPFDISLLLGCQECIDMFLEYGANTNRVLRDWTPLMRAASRGMHGVITSLLNHVADVRASNLREKTALHKAVDAECLDAVQILINAGADINASPREGLTPLHLAALQMPTESTFDIILALLRGGADMNMASIAGQHPIHLALSDFYLPTVRMLYYAGARSTDIGVQISNCLSHLDTLVSFLCENDFRDGMVYNPAIIEHNVRYMYEATRNPRSLQNLCCIFIRQCIDKNIGQKAHLLPLPMDLKRKVNFDDLEDLREYFNATGK
jgi:ankyrin repeat protein